MLKELCLEITDRCPARCIHCSGKASVYGKNNLSFESIKNIINDFKGLGGEILEISGGEPMFHKDIFRIVEYAKSRNLKIYLYTTGFGIINDSVARKLIRSSVDRFLFGLHGAKANTHEKITRTMGSFSETIRAIKKIKKLSGYAGMHFVPTSINWRELEKLCATANVIGVDELAILRFVPQGRGEKNRRLLELSKKEAKQFVSALKKLKKKYKFLRIGCPIDFQLKCKAAENTLTIRPDGLVTLCPAFKYKKIVGSIKKNGLKWIWENSSVLNAAREAKKKIDKHYGNCLAQRFYNNGKDPWAI